MASEGAKVSKKRKKRIIFACLLIIGLYLFMPIPHVSQKQRLAIHEQAFRFLYLSEEYGHKEKVDACYVDIGYGKLFGAFGPGNERLLKLKDPHDNLIRALNDLPTTIKPGSEYPQIDWDNPEAKEDYKFVQNSVCFGAGPIFKSLGLARCRTYYEGGPLCAAEYETFFVWTPWGWKYLFSFMLWIS